ncbi:MAG: phage tail tape measure protein [Oscillospiraceae bacterium]
MASKQYEMLFKLGARLGENFKGTFNSAQKALAATQKEIQSLNKTQSDISAYQKQQSGIDKTTKQLDTYKKQLEITQSGLAKLRQSTEDTTVEETQLAAREVELKNRIANTEQAIADKTQRLQQMGQKLADAGVDTSQLASESNRLKGKLEELAKQEEEAANEAKRFGDNGESAFEVVGAALEAAGIAAALNKIAEAYKECVSVSMEFGGTMSTVEALSGANAVQMQELTAKAKELGAQTAFTANQSAQAMAYMGTAGWDAGEMLSGMNGMINLAAASGEGLALVSDIVTDNLTAFGLKAKDTAHFADVLAAAASNSNTSVAIMGETFSGSASIAGALGYSIEDVAVGIGLMANAGVKGSVAGTALKNTFNGLLNGATLTADAFGEVEFSAVNADGTIDSFSDTLNELRGYFEQMTDAERVQNAMLISGQRGYNGLLAMINSTEEDYQSLTEKINNCTGAAQKMADIKLDNLQGDVTLLESATDGLKMTVGSLYNDELRRLTQAGTQIITGINDFCETNPAVVKSIMAVGAEIGVIVAGYTAFVAVKKISNALAAAGIGIKASENGLLMLLNINLTKNVGAQLAAAGAQMKLNAAMLLNPAGIIAVSVIALTAGLIVYSEATKAARLETLTLSTASQEECDNVERLNGEYQAACEQYGETSDQARALKYDLDEANASIEQQSFSVSELYAEIDSLHDSTTDLLSSYREGTDAVADQQEQAQILAAKLRSIAASSETAAHKEALMQPIIEKLNELYPTLGLTVENVSGKLDGLSDAIERAAGTDSIQAKYKASQENLAELMSQEEKLRKEAEKAEIAFNKAYNRKKSFLENVQDYGFWGGLGGSDYTKDLEKASEERNKVSSDLAAIRAAIAECENVIVDYNDTISGASEQMVSAYDAVSIAVNDVTEQTTELLQAYNDAYQAAYDSVSGQYNLWTNAEETIPTSIEIINNALSSQTEYWDNYNYNLETLSKRTGDIEGLGDVIASFADGSADSVNVIAGMADATDEELKAMVDNFTQQKKAQEAVSKSLADYRIDIDEQLNGVVSDMEKAVEDMNMSETAEQAAKDTIQAYAAAILAGKGSVTEAADIVAKAVSKAFSAARSADYYMNDPTAFNPADPYGYRKAYEKAEYQKAIAFDPYDPYNLAAYASGTDNAARGIALVGEKGPELVMMRGGERVIDADNTKAMLSGGSGAQITIAPQFVVNGEVSDMTESKLQEMSERLIDMVKDAIEEAGIDRQRSVYA